MTCSTHDSPSWPNATPTEDLRSLSSVFCHYRSVWPFLRFQINGIIWCELSALGFFHSAKEIHSFFELSLSIRFYCQVDSHGGDVPWAVHPLTC